MSSGINFDQIQEGMSLPELQVRMDRDLYFAYNKLVGNINPLHSDEAYARKLGFEDIVVAGVYTFSFITRMIEEWIGNAGRISSVTVKYQAPIYIDRTIINRAIVKKKSMEQGTGHIECEVSVTDPDGKLLTSALVNLRMGRQREF